MQMSASEIIIARLANLDPRERKTWMEIVQPPHTQLNIYGWTECYLKGDYPEKKQTDTKHYEGKV